MLVLAFKYRHRLNNVAVGDIIRMLNITNEELNIPSLYKVCKNIDKYSEVSFESKRIIINGKEVMRLSIVDQVKQLFTRKSQAVLIILFIISLMNTFVCRFFK